MAGGECEELSPVPVYSLYVVYLVASVVIEASIYGAVKATLEGKGGQSKMETNGYLLSKWF